MKRVSLFITVLLLILLANPISAQLVLDGLTLEQTAMPEAHDDIEQMTVVGNYWFVGDEGITIYDISDPSDPQRITTIGPMRWVRSFDYTEPYLFVSYSVWPQIDPFVIYDLTDMMNPVIVSEVEVSDQMGRIKYINGHLYTTDTSFDNRFVRVYNVTNPANPFIVYQEDGNCFYDIEVQGDLLVMLTSDGIEICDVSDPGYPLELSNLYGFNHNYTEFCINGNALYIAETGDDHICAYDIIDPSNPTLADEYFLDDSEDYDLEFNDNWLVLSQITDDYTSAYLIYYDINDPLNLIEAGQAPVDFIEDFVFASPSQDLIIGAVETTSRVYDDLFLVYDLTDHLNPDQVNAFGHTFVPFHMRKLGSIVYSAGAQGIWLVDWTDPDNPVSVYVWNGFRITDMELVGDYLYAGCRELGGDHDRTGLHIFDVSDPHNPQPVTYQPKSSIYEIEIGDDFAYIAANGIVGVYDISDPANPAIIGSVTQWSEEDRLTLADDILFVVGQGDNDDLHSYDVSDPAAPVLLDTYNTSYPYNSQASIYYEVSYNDGYLVVTGDDQYFEVFDVSNPTNIQHRTGFNDIYSYGGLVADGYLYVSDRYDGFSIYDFTYPYDPVYTGGLHNAMWFHRVLVDGNDIYAAAVARTYRLDSSMIVGELPVPQSLTAEQSGALVDLNWEEPQYEPPLVLQGYNVYRSGNLIATTEETSYLDLLTSTGTYNYTVTADYVSGESGPAGPVEIWFSVTLQLTLNPYDPYLQVPPIGGPVYFHVSLHNITSSPVDTDVWAAAVTSGGNRVPLQHLNVHLNPFQTLTRAWVVVNVPGTAPAGTYTYQALAGEHPSLILAGDSFNFTKLPGISSPYGPTDAAKDLISPEGWTLTGWDSTNQPPDGANDNASTAENGLTVSDNLPTEFAVAAYPNPFNERATITLSLPESGEVTAQIYDITGRRVATLMNGSAAAGVHRLEWDANGLASGVYYLRVQSGDRETAIRKLALVR